MVNWRAYGLDLKDYEIFLAQKENPLQSNASIGKRVGLSAEAVRNRIQAMKAKGFLRADRIINDPILGNRLQTEASGIYQPAALGLSRQHVLLQGIEDRDAFNRIRAFCDAHPYTHYRSPTYGLSAGLYIQFDIPPDAEGTMKTLYDRVCSEGLCEQAIVIDEKYFSLVNANFSRWDLKRDLWRVGPREEVRDERDRGNLMTSWSSCLDRVNEFRINEVQPHPEHQFDDLDTVLVRELTINSKPVLARISEAYAKDDRLSDAFKKDATTLSRRVSKIREHIVTRNRLYYDRRVFDLTYPQLITGQFKKGSEMTVSTLHTFVRSGVLPFETAVFSDTRSFLLYSTTPPSIAPDLSELIWDLAKDVRVFQLQLEASNTYFFYHKNYASGSWKVDRDYILDKPLSAVQ